MAPYKREDLELSLMLKPSLPREEDAGSSLISMTAPAAEGSASSGTVAPLAAAPTKNHHHHHHHPHHHNHKMFKGVVLQHNGHWGAQIYVNHQRIWLGTFRSEEAAAMAYDSAAGKLFHNSTVSSNVAGHHHHHHHHHRNFPATETTACELDFQERFSTEEVLAMIRDGSYQPRLAEFIRTTRLSRLDCAPAAPAAVLVEGCDVTELFQKELTPSDVGKLNRLVIPKKQAVRYLPRVPTEPPSSASEEEEMVVECRDREGRAWSFRYCYWKSSQSYVFTRGWNKFVKDKALRPKDVVAFYCCVEREGLRRSYTMIDVAKSNANGGGGGDGDGMVMDQEEVVSPAAMAMEEKKKRVTLFGVWIG